MTDQDTRAVGGPLHQPVLPMAPWEDERVQKAYEVLCAGETPPPEQHWEGYAARRIVGELGDAFRTEEYVAEVHGALMNAQLELRDLRKFRDFFADRCEALFLLFGMEPIDLYNTACEHKRQNVL